MKYISNYNQFSFLSQKLLLKKKKKIINNLLLKNRFPENQKDYQDKEEGIDKFDKII